MTVSQVCQISIRIGTYILYRQSSLCFVVHVGRWQITIYIDATSKDAAVKQNENGYLIKPIVSFKNYYNRL